MTDPDHTAEEPVAEGATGSNGNEATAAEGLDEQSGDPLDEAEAQVVAEGSDEKVDETPAETPEETLQRQLDERTTDLQRVQADLVNYRRRVERDRDVAREQGKTEVLKSLLTVLDDLDRADKHGELTGGFKAVSDQLWNAMHGHKLEQFGKSGEEFDAQFHDALFNAGTSTEVSQMTVDTVVKTGYRVGDDIIRHAEVGVVYPEPEKEPTDEDASADSASADVAQQD